MNESLVLTLIGPDRPGLVEALSKTIAAHGANWLESRMSHLAGKFAGILLVAVPEGRSGDLAAALSKLAAEGLRVVVEPSVEAASPGPSTVLELSLVGQDRPGIIRDISRVLAGRGVNVAELSTGCTSAPMSGEMLFRATARLELPPAVDAEDLRADLEELANDLMVDITLDTPEAQRRD